MSDAIADLLEEPTVELADKPIEKRKPGRPRKKVEPAKTTEPPPVPTSNLPATSADVPGVVVPPERKEAPSAPLPDNPPSRSTASIRRRSG